MAMPFKKRRVFDLRHVQAQQEMSSSQANEANKKSISNSGKGLRKEKLFWGLLQFLRWKIVKNWFKESLRNYCNTTSLHGFSYMTRTDISSAEKIFWIIVVVLSIIISILLVLVSWFWNRETPTVTVIESSHFPTWNIPFPAVTICNFNKISKSKASSLRKRMYEYEDLKLRKFYSVLINQKSIICLFRKIPQNVTQSQLHRLFNVTLFSETYNFTSDELASYDKILQLNNMTLSDLSHQLTPDCLDMVSRCIYKGMNLRCEALFQRITTMEGQCCSFNYFGATTNNFPAKIAYQVPKQPYRVTGCGYPTGLSVLLNPMVSDYYGTFFSSYGFRLLIHDAYNFPDENAERQVVSSRRESFVRISPESTYATNDIRRMDINVRNCLFGRERHLSTMQRYSFINCMFECRIQMAYSHCGCLPSFLPNNGSYPVCGVIQANCVIKTKQIFSHALANLNNSLSIVRQTREFPCNCLPDCQSNHYVSEISMGRLNVNFAANRITSSHLTQSTENHSDYILLHVFYSDLMSTRYRMEIFQNWLSSLASFGGLLGLIMGFSIVTAFEFIYFLTFRPVFNYMNHD